MSEKVSTVDEGKMSDMYLKPVIMPVPQSVTLVQGAEKNKALSLVARDALQVSAEMQGIFLTKLIKDSSGAPVPSDGIYWSLSHTDDYVAAVAAYVPVGIDIEKIIPYSNLLKSRIATNQEWDLVPSSASELLFYRYWTAKEAVLKAEKVGVAGLPHCTVSRIVSASRLELYYKERNWQVESSTVIPQHVVSITTHEMMESLFLPQNAEIIL